MPAHGFGRRTRGSPLCRSRLKSPDFGNRQNLGCRVQGLQQKGLKGQQGHAPFCEMGLGTPKKKLNFDRWDKQIVGCSSTVSTGIN